jgi:hypothetical protein
MDNAALEALLKSMTDWETEPALSQSDIDACMAIAASVDAGGNPPSNVQEGASAWASGSYEIGALVIDSAGGYWRSITAGTSGSVEPQWPSPYGLDVGGWHVVDNAVTWVYQGTAWLGSFGLDAAAAAAWRIKAGKAASRFGFMTDGQQFSRNQVHAMCLAMAQTYERRCAGTIRLRRADDRC